MASKGHKTRFSDSSRYDEVCVKCGMTDYNNGLNGRCDGEQCTCEPWSFNRGNPLDCPVHEAEHRAKIIRETNYPDGLRW